MTELNIVLALCMLLTIAAGLVRVWLGPTPADRMLAAQLFGSTGVAMLALLAQGLERPELRDVGLVLALLAAMASVVFVRRVWMPSGES